MNKDDLSAFDIEVLENAFKSTGSRTWDDEVIDWFWRMDFDPSRWQEIYLEFVKGL